MSDEFFTCLSSGFSTYSHPKNRLNNMLLLLSVLACNTEHAEKNTGEPSEDPVPSDSGVEDPEPNDSGITDSGDTDEECVLSPVNRIDLDFGEAQLFPLKSPLEGGVAFALGTEILRAFDENGTELWVAETGTGALFGGFDFDDDGWPDAGLVQTEEIGEVCGVDQVKNSWVRLISGQTGLIVDAIAPMKDICWVFESPTGEIAIYPTQQWVSQSILWGPNGGVLGVGPQYSTQSYFFEWNGVSGFDSEYFTYPSTSAFDSAYTAAQPNAYENGNSFIEFSHVANGLMLEHENKNKLVFFTSGRVLQYEVAPFSEAQLLVDHPYLNGNRALLGSRNYGLMSRNPDNPDEVVLIAGTDTYSVQQDLIQEEQGSFDYLGQLERHVTRYNMATDELEHRFFSCANDDNGVYQNRIAYPATALISSADGTPSRIAYNVYTDDHWHLHISEPGTTIDSYRLIDVFLWDIVDIDGDGVEEWFISPTGILANSNTAGAYFPKWEFGVYHWSEESLNLEMQKYWSDRLPLLKLMGQEAEKTSSMSYLAPILTKNVNCEKKIGTLTADGNEEWVQP
jgi:hypothetical protein